MARPKKDQMTDSTLTAIIEARKVSALNYRNGELSTKRINLLQRYLGKPYGTERPGQSSVVTRQCLEAVEWTLPSLLRVFMSSPTIVEFEPEGADDEKAAKQESDALNYVFMKKNDGFMTALTWIAAMQRCQATSSFTLTGKGIRRTPMQFPWEMYPRSPYPTIFSSRTIMVLRPRAHPKRRS